MDRSYRLGLAIVVGTVLASGILVATLAGARPTARPVPAGQSLGGGSFPLGSFRLVERSGRGVSEADFTKSVWIASFIFTRCPSSCPRISAVMKGLQAKLADGGVRLASISVDPDRDTPEVLAEYARSFGANPDRWWFLTGPKADVHRLILDRFRLGVAETSEAERAAGAEDVSHSERLALVDRGNKVVGVYSSSDPEALTALVARAAKLDAERPWVRSLPKVNATLNGTCAILLALGWVLIRSGRWKGHAACMATAVAVSALFLGSYLVYHYHAGSVAFRGVGPIRTAYFTILLSHTILATFGVVPLVGLTLVRAVRREYVRHASIAKITLPIWMYVSVTGVVIYWMLYQLDVPTAIG